MKLAVRALMRPTTYALVGTVATTAVALAEDPTPVQQVVNALTSNSGMVSTALPVILGIAVTFAILAIGKKLLSSH